MDEDGYPVRDRDSSSFIATFEPASMFARLVEAEGIRRGAGHVRQLTILGDGATWLVLAARPADVMPGKMLRGPVPDRLAWQDKRPLER